MSMSTYLVRIESHGNYAHAHQKGTAQHLYCDSARNQSPEIQNHTANTITFQTSREPSKSILRCRNIRGDVTTTGSLENCSVAPLVVKPRATPHLPHTNVVFRNCSVYFNMVTK